MTMDQLAKAQGLLDAARRGSRPPDPVSDLWVEALAYLALLGLIAMVVVGVIAGPESAAVVWPRAVAVLAGAAAGARHGLLRARARKHGNAETEATNA